MNEIEEKRKEELSALAYFLTKMCDSYDVCLYAKELENGKLAVLMHDNKTDKDYGIIREK